MPKLPEHIQTAADNAEVRDFSAIPAGLYKARVKDIDTDGTSAAGNAKWVFKVEILAGPNDMDDTKHAKRILFEHAALTEDSAWKMKQIFTALGYTMDSDADELVGEECQLMVSQGEIASGNKKGQMGNNIDSWLSATGDSGAELVGAAAGGGAAKKAASSSKKNKDDF